MARFDARFTSWGIRGRSATLYVEDGPEELGVFGSGTATVDGEPWLLQVDSKTGARATAGGVRTHELIGRIGRDKRLTARVGGRELGLINERRDDWIIEDARGEKVAQFSGGNNGVRRAILELEPAGSSFHEFSRDEVAALSWFVRLLLEARLNSTSLRLLIVLLAATLLTVLTILI